MPQASLTNRLQGVGENVSAFGLMLVLGEPRASCELRRVFLVRFACLEEASPVLVELIQHFLGYFCRQCFICFMPLHDLIHFIAAYISSLEDIRLPDSIVCCVVEIFRSECCCIYRCKARVILFD